MDEGDPVAVALAASIRAGHVDAVQRLLAERPGLAREQFIGPKGGSRTALHMVADWPGYFPHGPAIVTLLIQAGAEPSARSAGGDRPETPLHWAASSDDADVAEALISAGADIEAPGGSIGTPLDNAVGYGCWHVARLLVQRGPRVDKLWHAAALGLLPRLDPRLRQPGARRDRRGAGHPQAESRRLAQRPRRRAGLARSYG